jgi:hypothetical protein
MVVTGILGVTVGIYAFTDLQRDCPLFTWDDLASRMERPVVPDSPGLQLVGSVTKTRRYSMFHGGTVRMAVSGVTVLYEDHRYFFVEAAPDWFFRSLIDKSRFPHIASEPFAKIEKHPTGASSADAAVDEAARFLKSSTEGLP